MRIASLRTRVLGLAPKRWGPVILTVISAACGNGEIAGPPPGSSPINAVTIAISDTISGQATPQDTAQYYRFVPSEAMEVALFAASTGVISAFRLVDSASGDTLARLFSAPGLALLKQRSLITQLTAGNTYFVKISPLDVPAARSFRFFVYRVNRSPEHHAAVLALEEAVSNETLETSADIDEFTVPGSAGLELIGFLQALDPSLEGIADLRVQVSPVPPNGQPFVKAGIDDPEAATTRRFQVAADGPVRLTLSAESQSWEPGPTLSGLVRLQFRVIDRTPEQGGALVAIGDTVAGGAIDFVGDVDQYTIAAPPGTELNVFLQATNDTSTSVLSLTVLPNVTSSDGQVQSLGTDASLATQATGRFLVPSTGLLTLEVAGFNDFSGLHRGVYRFFVYPIRREPEILEASLILGQSLDGETIELPGDIDEFVLTAPQATLANFALSASPRAGIRLAGSMVNGDRHFGLLLFPDPAAPAETEVTSGHGSFVLQEGTYKLTVDGPSSRGDGYRGSYRVQSFDLDSLPESVGPGLALESSVSEALTPLGDRDLFTLTGDAGDLLDITLAGGTSAEPPGMMAAIYQLGATGEPLAAVTAAGSGRPPHHSGRLELPASGTYQLSVIGINGGRSASEVGPYQLALLRYPTDPEHSSATLTPGVEVATEGLGSLGDVDDFVLSATPGTEIQVLFRKATAAGGVVQLHAADANTGVLLRSMASAGFDQASGRVTVPVGGSLRLRFSEPRFPGCYNVDCAYHVIDAYRFTPVVISRSPETAGSAVSFGSIVEEAIHPVGDIDVFTFSGIAGQQVRVNFQSVSLLAGGAATLVLLDPSGNQLGQAQVGNPTGEIRNVSTGTIPLPVTGIYRVRVQGVSDQVGSGVYRILVE